MSWRCTAPTKTESPDSTGTTLEELKGNVRITVLLSTCPLVLLQTIEPPPPKLHQTSSSLPHEGSPDWLQVMVGREGNAGLGIRARVLSVQFKGTWFVCILGVCCISTDCWLFQQSGQKLYEEAEDRCVRLSGELVSTLLSEPFPGGCGMTSRGMYTVKHTSSAGLTLESPPRHGVDVALSTRDGEVLLSVLSASFCLHEKTNLLKIRKPPTSVSCFTQKSQPKPSTSPIMRFDLFGFFCLFVLFLFLLKDEW